MCIPRALNGCALNLYKQDKVPCMSGLTERLYFASPIWAQQMLVALYGWRWYHQRFNPSFYRLVAELSARDNWSAERFRAFQEEQLRNLLLCATRSPYYGEILNQANFDLQQNPFRILERLPLLAKETLRTQSRELLTQNPLPKGTRIFKSSGTTGTPTELYYTPEFHAFELAVPAVRNLGWAGISFDERRVMFGVRKVCSFVQAQPPFWRFSPAENMAYASIYHLSPRYLPYYLEFLRNYQPAIVMGYPSSLNTIARYALENNDYPAPAKGVFTTSETVTVQARETIESAWRCKVYDRYGAVEGCVFASQCEHGRYHVSPEVGVLELIDRNGNPVPPGVMGEVVCTGLVNLLQPLIRYRIGDVARWALDQTCPCGRRMPVLESVEGRYEDICYTPDGRETLRFDTVFKGVEHIKEAQVIQQHLDHFMVYVVPGKGYSDADVERIQANMYLHVGEVTTQVQTVDAIPRTASGKFRAVICNIPESERNALFKSDNG